MDINRSAPATASAETLVRAPCSLVWEVLAGIEDWPRWNPDVTRAELRGPFASGTAFRWKAGGLPITSTLEEVVPERRLVWTGRTMSIRAVHVWTFEDHEEGTLVRTEESFEGLIVRLLAGPMQRMLASSLEKGLAALKAECERRVGKRRRDKGRSESASSLYPFSRITA